MPNEPGAAPDRRCAWLMAIRPRTLGMAVTPVVVGACLAHAEAGRIDWAASLIALISALLIQIGTNLHNDAADFANGGDGDGRLGPPRASAGGYLQPAAVRAGAYGCFALAGLAGAVLVVLGGWPILLIGGLGLLAGLGYSAGPRPIAFSPLGELFVVLFFGLAAVGGSFWLNARLFSPNALLVGAAIGLPAAAVLLVNNHRDRIADRRAGRRTLAILIGPQASRLLYAALVLAPFIALAPLRRALPGAPPVWLAWAALPPALGLVWRMAVIKEGRGLNGILAGTVLLQAFYGLLLGLGMLLGG